MVKQSRFHIRRHTGEQHGLQVDFDNQPLVSVDDVRFRRGLVQTGTLPSFFDSGDNTKVEIYNSMSNLRLINHHSVTTPILNMAMSCLFEKFMPGLPQQRVNIEGGQMGEQPGTKHLHLMARHAALRMYLLNYLKEIFLQIPTNQSVFSIAIKPRFEFMIGSEVASVGVGRF